MRHGLFLVGTAAFLVHCGPPSRARSGARPPRAPMLVGKGPPPASAASVPSPRDAQRPPPSLRDVLCDEKYECEVKETLASTPGPAGTTRSAVRIEFPEPPTSEEDDPRCSFEEYWLVEQGPDGRIGEHKPFASGCTPNPPEGSWCGTAPSAKVEIQGVLAIVKWEQPMMRCASAFLSYGVEKVSLETFHSVYSSSTTYRSIEPGESTSEEWDWSSLRGALEWSVDADSFCPRIHRKATPTIPKLAIDDDFVNVGWTTVPMEACSTKFDDRHGVTLGGPRAKVALRAVVAMGTRIGTSDVLFVEVEPDPGTEIPPDAYLEVCASERPLSTGYCSPMPIATCQKFRFGGALSKGKLTAERSPNLARFKVPLPEGRDALTVAYEEPKTRRSIASSRIPRRDTTVMSTVFELGEELATCRMKDGALSVVREPDKL